MAIVKYFPVNIHNAFPDFLMSFFRGSWYPGVDEREI